MLRIGPSGNSDTFYESGRTKTVEAAQWLSEIGLSAFEYSFGRGVNLSDATAAQIKEQFTKFNIGISVHAPYYTNFSNPDPEMIMKSIGYVVQSVDKVIKMGGERVVVHPATCGKLSRVDAVELAKSNLTLLSLKLKELYPQGGYKICLETMGKMQQIGTAEEIVDFCKIDDNFYPCFDFGHINCYMQGKLNSYEEYRKIIDNAINVLGKDKVADMHIHFSKIQFGKGGEVRHLTLSDTEYGPPYEPLATIINEYGLTPYIICESKDVMSDDALIMKKYHKNI